MPTIRTTRRTNHLPRRLAVAAVAASLTLSACGGGGGDGGGATGESVPADATKAEFQAAFEDLDPITLVTQTAGAEGSVTSAYFEAYEEAITDWSGGKIEFDTNYAYSVAPPTEVSDAVADGRLDLTYTIPTYQPDELPASNALIDLTIAANHTPLVGLLQLIGWSLDASSASDQVKSEFEDIGLHALIPVYSLGPDALFCTEPRSTLEDFDGATARMGARFHSAQFEALGLESVSLDLSELFEALQRGVADCTVANPMTASLTGTFEIAPHAGLAPSAGFGSGVGGMVINTDVWDELPLPAQQLIHDRLDVFIKQQIVSTLSAVVEAVVSTKENGGGLKLFGDDVASVLEETNAKMIEANRQEIKGVDDSEQFVDDALTKMDEWLEVVTTDLGFDPEMTPEEFVAWYEDQEDDVFDEFVARVFTDAMSEHRPS